MRTTNRKLKRTLSKKRRKQVITHYIQQVVIATSAVAVITIGITHITANAIKVDIVESKTILSKNIGLACGIKDINIDRFKAQKQQVEQTKQIEQENQEKQELTLSERMAQKRPLSETYRIRCTCYTDVGYTKSGAWTHPGILAGREEWLGKWCNLYHVDKDGNCGYYIGTYQFLDTGFGLTELDGKYYSNGTIPAGASIDMWVASDSELEYWQRAYGDYVYIEFIDEPEDI